MSRPLQKARRGFTLVELLVASTVTVTVVAFTLTTLVTQQRAFMSLDVGRVAQESARDALTDLEPALRRAGFGVEPRYAFDFKNYACISQTGCIRDRTADADELVFYARNPYYRWVDNGVGTCTTPGGCFSGNSWSVTLTNSTQISLNARTGDTFLKGRVLLAACANGLNMTMATVATTAVAGANGVLTVSLLPAVAGDPYKENNWNACHTQTGGAAFFVDRSRYMIKAYGGVPYLMLDNGLDLNRNGATPDTDVDDVIPVAAGVEDLQVAYVYARGTSFGFAATDLNTNWVVGDVPGSFEQPNPFATAPVFGTGSAEAIRYNLHPGNIRAVRISLVLRSIQPDPGPPKGWLGDPLLEGTPARPIENRNVGISATALGRFRRVRVSSSITLRDMESRSPFIF